MPVQTTEKGYVQIPDGAKVEIDGGSGYVDLGAFNSDITATLNYEINEILSSNAGKIRRVGNSFVLTIPMGFITTKLINPNKEYVFSFEEIKEGGKSE